MSTIIAGGVGAFVGFLLAQGFTEIQSRVTGLTTTIFGTRPNGKPFKVTVQNEALANPQYDVVELDTGTTTLKKPNIPQFTIENNASGDKRIYTIGIVPDTTFKTQGIMEILLNEVRLFPISTPAQGMFKNISSLNIPIPANYGLRIVESKKLEVFIWNPSAASATVNFALFIANIR